MRDVNSHMLLHLTMALKLMSMSSGVSVARRGVAASRLQRRYFRFTPYAKMVKRGL